MAEYISFYFPLSLSSNIIVSLKKRSETLYQTKITYNVIENNNWLLLQAGCTVSKPQVLQHLIVEKLIR